MAESSRTIEVCNQQGVHARPCHAIVSIAMQFDGELRVRCGERDVNAKSILELMTLNACHGSVLEFRATGNGADDVLDELETLVRGGFGEMSKG